MIGIHLDISGMMWECINRLNCATLTAHNVWNMENSERIWLVYFEFQLQGGCYGWKDLRQKMPKQVMSCSLQIFTRTSLLLPTAAQIKRDTCNLWWCEGVHGFTQQMKFQVLFISSPPLNITATNMACFPVCYLAFSAWTSGFTYEDAIYACCHGASDVWYP